MPKFELNQKLNLMYLKMVVPCIITKRIKMENIDTGKYEYYYDYKHDIPSGYSFTHIDEEYLLENYREALQIGIDKIVNGG